MALAKLNSYEYVRCEVREADLFEEAVELIKHNEGWHSKKHHPYIGYGHRLLRDDPYDHRITKKQAEHLLKKDLLKKCAAFRSYGRDSLILGVLAYNVGEYAILGHGKKPKSKLLKKLESGDRNVYADYVSFCLYKGKKTPSIYKRRVEEFNLLFNKTKLKTK